MNRADLARRHRVEDGKKFRLGDVDPSDTAGLDIEKDEAKALLADSLKDLKELQERLYAEGERAVLVVLQAMDAGGKDSAIEHVTTGINPQGCDVKSFKQPGPVELRHDFLWRHVIGPFRKRCLHGEPCACVLMAVTDNGEGTTGPGREDARCPVDPSTGSPSMGIQA